MGEPEFLTTTVSSKGRIVLPKAIRRRRGWNAGAKLLIEETPEGVLLKRAPAFAATRPEDVFGMLPYQGAPKPLDEMEAGLQSGGRGRKVRGRETPQGLAREEGK
jgi:AbrB family looped-hinge helix DNA binding protein